MFSNFIKTSVIAAALALGSTAIAGDTGTNNGSQTQMQQGQNTQQQGVMNENLKSVRLTALDKQQLKDVQVQLKDLGLYKGGVDGVLGNQTRGALQAFFQQQLSLVGQGRISDQALSGFGFAKTDIEKVRGIDESNGNVRQNTSGQESPSINNNSGALNKQPQTQPQTQPQPTQPTQPTQRQPY